MVKPKFLGQLLDAYSAKHLRWAAKSTLKQYTVTLRNVTKYLGRPAVITDLSDDFVQDVMAWFINRGRTQRGANKVRSNLHCLWSFACRMGWLSKWPDSKPLKEPQRIPTAWTRDELRTLFETLALLLGTVGPIPASLWWLALHAVIWDTAERIGAVRQLTWSDISLTTGRVTFKAETRKNKTRDRQHALHPDTVAILGRLKQFGCPIVFPWDRSECYLWLKYKAILKGAGLPHGRGHAFHCMRKSSASYFEASGGDATKLLDHSSRAVTTRFYLDPAIVGKENPHPCEVLFRPTGS
ncbi:MAG: site-specific integrase [Planctomycetaceae bacterium]|nr:site-specific integrase [Planctomycetaceae bacterium]